VAALEDLFRIVSAEWIHEGRVSSGAFTFRDCFSVEISSRTSGPLESLSRVPGACAVVRFNCGQARAIGGMDTRDERDEFHPENQAHAHVYTDPTGNSRRKTLAKAFVTQCKPEIVLNQCGAGRVQLL
jgi:hypothetical protein